MVDGGTVSSCASTSVPFLPTPMGKGVLPDSHPLNAAAARSIALQRSDVVLILGARLNWILHFGEAPKWNSTARFVQVDISAEEIGRNRGDAELGIVGDVATVKKQLNRELDGWSWDSSASDYAALLEAGKAKNEQAAAQKAIVDKIPMTYARTFDFIRSTLHSLSPNDDCRFVYVCEGANTMDISRSMFPVQHPRLRLDAGTHATMGVGLGYAIAAHAAYNQASTAPQRRKKIVAIEGDSAFGFSAMEVETMARYSMDIVIFVINNGGVYHGDSASADDWLALQAATTSHGCREGAGLRSTTLGWEVGYEKLADMCGGIGIVARTPQELREATVRAFKASVPVVVNVIIEAGAIKKLVCREICASEEADERTQEFAWQSSNAKASKKDASKL